jgi:D-alanine-D-alanine ligase
MALRVLHLVGSPVSDLLCDLSVLYAGDCLDATADPARYEFHVAYVTPDRRWRFPCDLSPRAIAAAPAMSAIEAIGQLRHRRIDVMVPQMFCIPGMTYYRGLFDLVGIPYLGNPPDVMALASNKALTRAVVAAAGVRVPTGELLRPGDVPSLTPPVVVKPVDSDNSTGVTFVAAPGDFAAALDAAFAHADRALVEDYIAIGREVRCGIISQGGELVCLPLEEYDIHPERKPIRGYDDKLRRDGDGDLHLVAKDPTRAWIVERDDPLTERVWALARVCHEALGCRHYSLFDFRVDPLGHPWFLEAGPYCSFARKSVLSVMASAAGIPVQTLFATVLHEALGI